MATFRGVPDRSPDPRSSVAELNHVYAGVQRTYAEALARATSYAQQTECRERIARLGRQWKLLDVDKQTEVLSAITVMHAEQRAVEVYVAAQIVAAGYR